MTWRRVLILAVHPIVVVRPSGSTRRRAEVHSFFVVKSTSSQERSSWISRYSFSMWSRSRAILSFTSGVMEGIRSEEHTSELQSRENLVCRLLLEKKNEHTIN